jgi:hypothetical protein
MSKFTKILESLMNDDESTAYRLFHEFVVESSKKIYEEHQLDEASYDGMIASMKAKYPDFQQEIADQLKWAKATLKKDEKIVWYMKNVGNMLADQQAGKQVPDIKAIQNDLGHFFGFNIPAVDSYQFGKKSYDEIMGDLRSIEQDWSEKQSKNNLPPIEPQEGDYELMKFPDGSAWWWVDRAYCEKEGEYGKHCGNITGKSKPDQRILSLRKNGQVLLTFILEPNGNLGEMKAYNNQKPSEKLHPQIMSLLLSDKVKGIQGGGYLADNNFSVFDLSDENLQVIQNKKPNLISDQIKVSPSQALKAPTWVRKMYINEISGLSPGLQYLIDPNTGEYTNDPAAWDKAIQTDPKLSLNVPSNLIDRYKDVILDVLKRDPKLLISQANRDIRRNFEILKGLVLRNYNNLGYVQPTTPGYAKLCKIAVSLGGDALQYVPEELITPKLCKIAVSQYGWALQYVPEELRTSELCKRAVSNFGRALEYVPKDLPEYLEICKIAVSKDDWALQFVPIELRTSELCKIAVSQNWRTLELVPEELPEYPEICEIAVSQKGWALRHVPRYLLTPALYKAAVSQGVLSLDQVPEKLRTPELYKIAVSQSGGALKYVPEELPEYAKLCKIAVSNEGLALKYVPEELRTSKLCKIAVSQKGWALYWVPEELPEYEEICKIAVSQDGEALRHVPEELPEYADICKIAVSQNGYALEIVPEELRTPTLCKIAVSQAWWALELVPEELPEYAELCKIAVSQDVDALELVPEELRDEVLRAVEQEKQQR